MATDVIMPQMGESIAEGTIVKWLKKIGEDVKRDEPLFEISTDKVDAEIPSPSAGVLTEILAQEGQTVPINTVVARIAEAGAQPAAKPAEQPAEKPAEKQQAAAASQSPAPQPAQPVAQPSQPSVGQQQQERIIEQQESRPVDTTTPVNFAPTPSPMTEEELRRHRSSPLVRKIARENNVDIRNIEGTGMGGRVTKNDILSYMDSGKQAAPQPAAQQPAAQQPAAQQAAAAQPAAQKPASTMAVPPPPPTFHVPAYQSGDRVEIVPLTPMRKKIAEHMVASRHISAHVSTFFENDMTTIEKLREKHKEAFFQRHGVKLTFMPFIVKAAVDALRAFPMINASIEGDNIVYKKDINIGIAVALDWGLIVPVIKHADELNLIGLARAVQDLGTRARNKQLKPDEVQGGTFTITNPGAIGGLIGTPIINQPQVAIMGVGIVEKRVSVIPPDDAIAVRSKAFFTLSFDHRLIDGAVADNFMAHVKKSLENYTTTEL